MGQQASAGQRDLGSAAWRVRQCQAIVDALDAEAWHDTTAAPPSQNSPPFCEVALNHGNVGMWKHSGTGPEGCCLESGVSTSVAWRFQVKWYWVFSPKFRTQSPA